MSIVDGDQDPVIPFNEVVAKIGGVDPKQRAGIELNVGVTKGFIVH